MVANRRGVLGDVGSGDSFEGVLIHLQIFLKVVLVVVVEVISEVVMNPTAMASDGLTVGDQVMNPFLRLGIMIDVQVFVVTKGIDIGAGSEVHGKAAPIENALIREGLERRQRRAGINMPV